MQFRYSAPLKDNLWKKPQMLATWVFYINDLDNFYDDLLKMIYVKNNFYLFIIITNSRFLLILLLSLFFATLILLLSGEGFNHN